MSASGPEFVDQVVAAGEQGGRQASLQLLAQHIVNGPAAARQCYQGGDRLPGGGKAGDQRALAVTDQDHRREARISLEFFDPGSGVGHVGFHAEVAFIWGQRQAFAHAALVVAKTGDTLFRQALGQPLEAVVVAHGVIAVAIGRARAGDHQRHGERPIAFRQQQAAMQATIRHFQNRCLVQQCHGLGERAGHGEEKDEQKTHGQTSVTDGAGWTRMAAPGSRPQYALLL